MEVNKNISTGCAITPDNTVNISVTNSCVVPKTYRLFGVDTGLDNVDDNIEIGTPVLGSSIASSVGNIRKVIYSSANNSLYSINNTGGRYLITNLDDNTTQSTLFAGVIDIIIANNYIYISTLNSGDIRIINIANGNTQTLNAATFGITQMVYDESNNKVYARWFDNISVIDNVSHSVLGYINGTGPDTFSSGDMCINNGFLYSSCPTLDLINVIDTSSDSIVNVINFPSSSFPNQLKPFNNLVYVSGNSSNDIYQINDNTILNTVSLSVSPRGYNINNTSNEYIYVASSTGIIKLNTDTLSYSILGNYSNSNFTYVEYIPNEDYIYTNGPLVQVYSSEDQLITTITILPRCNNFAYSSNNGYVYTGTESVGTAFIYPIIPDIQSCIEIIVNGGITSLSQLQVNFAANPVCINNIQFLSSERSAYIYDLLKIQNTSTGVINQESHSLYSKATSYDKQNVVNFLGSEFDNCVLDGQTYLQHTIPPLTTINYNIKYSQYDSTNNINNNCSAKTKKYIRASARVFLALNR